MSPLCISKLRAPTTRKRRGSQEAAADAAVHSGIAVADDASPGIPDKSAPHSQSGRNPSTFLPQVGHLFVPFRVPD
jgi:hypothetical protein